MSRANAVDVAARVIASLAPRSATPAIDQVRRDANRVLAGLSGARSATFRDGQHAPRVDTPLAEVDAVSALLPRALAERFATLQRDVRSVRARLAGERPPTFRTRSAPAAVTRGTLALVQPAVNAAAAPGLHPRALRVTAVARETADAVSLQLEDAGGASLTFKPGEFLTLLVTVGDEQLRRAYSLSSAALPGVAATITVKRVPEGRASGHLNADVRAGDVLEVLGPSGSFTVTPDPHAQRHLVLVGGGSGITPLMSIARTVLALEPASRVSLVYGNRAWDDVIFRDALADLAAAHPTRFALRHVLAQPPAGWTGGAGMLDRATVARELGALPVAPDAATEFFVCGPEAMMTEARAALVDALGVAPARIHEEKFLNPQARPRSHAPAARRTALPVAVTVSGTSYQAVAAPGQTVLEAGLAAGAPMPFSCAMGGCGACRVKLAAGEVEMEEPNCLAAHEREAGYVLACVARPVAAVAVAVP